MFSYSGSAVRRRQNKTPADGQSFALVARMRWLEARRDDARVPVRHALVRPRRLQERMRALRREALARVRRLRRFDHPSGGARLVRRLHKRSRRRAGKGVDHGSLALEGCDFVRPGQHTGRAFPRGRAQGFQFSMLDKRDLSPVGYKRYSKKSGKEVQWADIVKGYEYEKDQYVVLSDEDFRRANVKASRTIDIKAFVPAAEIPPQYYETPYYLAPADRGEKVYALLRETLRATGRVAVAQVVIRTTEHLAAVVPQGRALMLVTMRHADEIRGASGFELPAEGLKSAGVSSKEVDLAKRLVDDMTEHWKPEE